MVTKNPDHCRNDNQMQDECTIDFSPRDFFVFSAENHTMLPEARSPIQIKAIAK